MDKRQRDEHALVLFNRMLNRRPVWVDSPAGQMVWIGLLGVDDDDEIIAYDHEGNDRLVEEYLLDDPHEVYRRLPDGRVVSGGTP